MCCITEFIVKYVLFFFNFLLAVVGLIFLISGILALLQLSDILELIPINIELIPILLLVLGSIVFVIAFFGCCGALRESRCLLIMYVVSMMVIGILAIIITVRMFMALNNIEEWVQGWLTDAFNNPTLSEPFLALEITFRCCGTTGADSYPVIPPRCCANPIQGTCGESSQLYDGCNEILSNLFSLFGNVVSYSCLGVIFVVIVTIVFGIFLSSRITQRNKKVVF